MMMTHKDKDGELNHEDKESMTVTLSYDLEKSIPEQKETDQQKPKTMTKYIISRDK